MTKSLIPAGDTFPVANKIRQAIPFARLTAISEGLYEVEARTSYVVFTFVVRGENRVKFSMVLPPECRLPGPDKKLSAANKPRCETGYAIDAQTAFEIAKSIGQMDEQ